MKHFVVFPSAQMERGMTCARLWMYRGYDALIGVDEERGMVKSGDILNAARNVPRTKEGDLYFPLWCNVPSPFPGYYRVINDLVTSAFAAGADLVTCVGDDMEPPSIPNAPSHCTATEHSLMYFHRFPDGEGVMQCTGDRQGEVIDGKVNSERICGSPTFGKGWWRDAFDGKGPFGDFGFRSFFCDELLGEYAKSKGLLYQEPALTILHKHWSWRHMAKQDYHERAQANWGHDKAIYERLKAEGFGA